MRSERSNKKKGFALTAAYVGLITVFTGYVMLDTFVIPEKSDTDAGQMNMSLFEGEQKQTLSVTDPQADTKDENSTASQSSSSRKKSKKSKTAEDTSAEKSTSSGGNVSSDSYSDENISITLTTYREYDTNIYVADVKLSSAQYLKTAFANDTYGRNVKAPTTDIAEDKNAILAVNGDFYGARTSGYVIRNGILYRSTGTADTDVLCIYADGHFEITNSSEKSAQELVDEGVWQAFSFGPALIEDGSITVNASSEVGRAMASNPRTAIGIIENGHYLFVVSDGRTDESTGLSLLQLAQFMKGLGAETAYNLDGGGSSTMVMNGKLINHPTTSGKSESERSVSDIVYIGY